MLRKIENFGEPLLSRDKHSSGNVDYVMKKKFTCFKIKRCFYRT